MAQQHRSSSLHRADDRLRRRLRGVVGGRGTLVPADIVMFVAGTLIGATG